MFRILLYVLLALGSLVGLLGVSVGLLFLTTPRPNDIKGCLTTEMYKVHLCPTEPGYAKLKDISLHLRNAVIVSEDAGFYGHKGIDWEELRMSAETNWQKGQLARGGSTISQQLAKNIYLTGEKTFLRKIREAIITVQLEEILSKDEILEKYLNVVEFGPKIFGVTQAARVYYGKTPNQLGVLESVHLAFLLPSPVKYSASYRNHTLSRFTNKQMQIILSRLVQYKKISQEEYQTALNLLPHFFEGTIPAAELKTESDEQDILDLDLEEF